MISLQDFPGKKVELTKEEVIKLHSDLNEVVKKLEDELLLHTEDSPPEFSKILDKHFFNLD